MNAIQISSGELELTWHVARVDQGQIVEVAYAAYDGGILRRTFDRSDMSRSYDFASYDDMSGEFEPWNGPPKVALGAWVPVTVSE